MRILLVEDDGKIASFIVKRFQQAGFAIDHADNGEDGLHLGLAPPYDASIVDIMLVFQDEVNPAMDAAFAAGLEVTALHNHFFFDKSKVYFMNLGGHGDPEKLAASSKSVWGEGTPEALAQGIKSALEAQRESSASK